MKRIKVCILGDSPVMKAISEVTGIVDAEIVDTEIVDTIATADLVVASSVKEIEQGFNSDKKQYAIINLENLQQTVPNNVHVFGVLNYVNEYYKLIAEVSEKLQDTKEGIKIEKGEVEGIPLLPDAKSILVIDDTPKHIASAQRLLAGHKLEVVEGYEKAMKTLANSKFEVVLSDLQLPMSSNMLGGSKFKLGDLVPYGLLLRDEAARQGAKYVAVVSDFGHHGGPFEAAFDHFSQFTLRIEGAKVMMMHAKILDNGSKDWKYALDKLLDE